LRNKQSIDGLITNDFIFNLRELVASYNLLVSEIMYFREKVLNDLSQISVKDKRIVQKNIPHIIERLQCLFIESSSITLISIIELKKNMGSKSPGLGKLSFCKYTSMFNELQKDKLKGTKYMYSTKPLRLKFIPKGYELTEIELIKLKNTIKILDLKVIDKLLKQCLIKTFNKNYKAGSVERVWVEKKNSFEGRPLGIPTLRDRVLQKIV